MQTINDRSVRAKCPMCGLEMIYSAFVIDELTVWSWICNCRRQPDFMLADIASARLTPFTSLVYELEIANEPASKSD